MGDNNMNGKQGRLRRAKGHWMRLVNPDLMRRYMKERDFSQARLGRYAGCSRQFIWQLLNDPGVKTCTPEIGRRIEEALGVLSETLFMPSVSPEKRPAVTQRTTRDPKAA